MRCHTQNKTRIAETVNLEMDSMEEGVVLFCITEKTYEDNPHNVIENATKEVIRRLEIVKTKKIMIYPYVHFISDSSSPKITMEILAGLETSLKGRDLDVRSAAFGWYKELKMRVKQHPLSNISITALPDNKQKSEF